MTQIEPSIRRTIDVARIALEWARAHAGLLMAALLLLAGAHWLWQHDAQLKREAALGQMRRETAAEVSALRTRAEGAMKEFRASERMIRDLESRRANLEHEAAALRARLTFLREEERVRVRAAATLGQPKVSGRVALRPDPARQASDPPESGAVAAPEAGSEISDVRLESRVDSETREFKIQDFTFQRLAGGSRGVDEAALDSCREQSAVQDRLISNCEERAELNRAALEAAKRSALELGEALRAKDAIAARMAEQHRAELKVARGSRLRRMGRALQYIGAGVVIGMAVAK